MLTATWLLFFPVADFVGGNWDPPDLVKSPAGVAVVIATLVLLILAATYVATRLVVIALGLVMASPLGHWIRYAAPRLPAVGATLLTFLSFYSFLAFDMACAQLSGPAAMEAYWAGDGLLDFLLPDLRLLGAAAGAAILGLGARAADLPWGRLGLTMALIALFLAALSVTTAGWILGQVFAGPVLMMSETARDLLCR